MKNSASGSNSQKASTPALHHPSLGWGILSYHAVNRGVRNDVTHYSDPCVKPKAQEPKGLMQCLDLAAGELRLSLWVMAFTAVSPAGRGQAEGVGSVIGLLSLSKVDEGLECRRCAQMSIMPVCLPVSVASSILSVCFCVCLRPCNPFVASAFLFVCLLLSIARLLVHLFLSACMRLSVCTEAASRGHKQTVNK